MRTKLLVGLLLLAPALAGCGSTAPPDTDPTGTPTGGCTLPNTSWNLSGTGASLGNMAANNITLEFAANKATGSGGVSPYAASFTSAANGMLTFNDVRGEPASGEQGAMSAQKVYLKTLGDVTGFSCTDKTLALFVGDEQVYIYVPG